VDEEEKTKWIEVSAVWDYGSVDVVCNSLVEGDLEFIRWVWEFGVWLLLWLYTPITNTNEHFHTCTPISLSLLNIHRP
jgi:hypothetical protein